MDSRAACQLQWFCLCACVLLWQHQKQYLSSSDNYKEHCGGDLMTTSEFQAAWGRRKREGVLAFSSSLLCAQTARRGAGGLGRCFIFIIFLKQEKKNEWRQEVRKGEKAAHKVNLKMGFVSVSNLYGAESSNSRLIWERVRKRGKGRQRAGRLRSATFFHVSQITQREDEWRDSDGCKEGFAEWINVYKRGSEMGGGLSVMFEQRTKDRK